MLRRKRPWRRDEYRLVAMCFGCGGVFAQEDVVQGFIEWRRRFRKGEERRGGHRCTVQPFCRECVKALRRVGRLRIAAWGRGLVLDMNESPGRWMVRQNRTIMLRGSGAYLDEKVETGKAD